MVGATSSEGCSSPCLRVNPAGLATVVEQVVGGKVVANTVSVTEERKTEEIHETPPQSAKDPASLEAASPSVDAQPPAVGDAEPPGNVDQVAASKNETATAEIDDHPPASPTSPEISPTSPQPESTDGGKKDRPKKFSLFGKKKNKKSSSESEDLKNAADLDVDDSQKRSSLGRKNKSPKSADDVGKRTSGGPFGFFKRGKAKPGAKVPVSESAPALELDAGDEAAGARVIYELEVEGGDAVATARAKPAPGPSGTAVTDEVTAAGPVDPGHRHLVVVAVDFGTTFSGYAFSFVPSDPRDASTAAPVHMMRRWEGGDPGVVNQKTLTALLLTPEGQFEAFGFTARNLYHDLDPADAQRWMYFDKFKMDLHNNPV